MLRRAAILFRNVRKLESAAENVPANNMALADSVSLPPTLVGVEAC